MTLPKKDYYGVLHLAYGASEHAIRQRYRRLARKYHPDLNRSPEGAARFREIAEAYEVLTTPELKHIADAWYATAVRAPLAESSNRGTDVRPSHATPLVYRLFSFGCFGTLAFFGTIFGGWMSSGASPHIVIMLGLIVGALVGCIAALSDTRMQERLLRWLGWWS